MSGWPGGANDDFWDFVRSEIIGRDATISTPFGAKQLLYADHTASGRGVRFIEEHIQKVLTEYGNTHTEDDATGSVTTIRLEHAEKTIKRLVGASQSYKVVLVGSGSTGAVHRLQQILGVYLPPAAKEILAAQVREFFAGRSPSAGESTDKNDYSRFMEFMLERRPIVFVGPYEHHSNEVSWRECWADVVEIDLTPEGFIDLEDLARKVSDPVYDDRVKMGAFSAASNVSGVMTPVYEVARILHRHDAYAFFDFAAIAPYVEIDVNRDEESYFDAIYFSPHKFLGGPGSSGALVFHERIYRSDLAPTVSGGGTVNYVWETGQDYIQDIEIREKAGTPGILQTIRASMVMELKEELGLERIRLREEELMRRGLDRLRAHQAIEIIGPRDPDDRMAIVSFNIHVESSFLHPRYVTVLLNDLFGIQSRAGCSCAGPYGHRLLHLTEFQSKALRERIATGVIGLRPGWVRVNFHYLMTDEEFDFLCDAILFVADRGRDFLPLYQFDMQTGGWCYHAGGRPGCPDDPVRAEITFGLQAALRGSSSLHAEQESGPDLYRRYLDEARALADRLRTEAPTAELKTTEKNLIPFVYV